MRSTSRLMASLILASLLSGCVGLGLAPIMAIKATTGLVAGAVSAIATTGTVAAGAGAAAAATAASASAGAAASTASATGGKAAAGTDIQELFEVVPQADPVNELVASAEPPGSPQSSAASGWTPEGASSGGPAFMPGTRDDDENDRRGARGQPGYQQGGSSSRGGASQCAQGPGYSACQQADVGGMAMAVAGALVVSSLFRDGEQVGSMCEINCGDTEISVSCPLPATPVCVCGDAPQAFCQDPEDSLQDVARAEPPTVAASEKPDKASASDDKAQEKNAVLQKQAGK